MVRGAAQLARRRDSGLQVRQVQSSLAVMMGRTNAISALLKSADLRILWSNAASRGPMAAA